jgi:hypothetical protein
MGTYPVASPAVAGRGFGRTLVNIGLVVLVVLFLIGTGGEQSTWFSLLLLQFYPYVLLFLALEVWQWARHGAEDAHKIAGLRFLRALEETLVSPRTVYPVIAGCTVLGFCEGGSTGDAEFVVVDELRVKPTYRPAHDAAVTRLSGEGFRPIFEQERVAAWRRVRR